MFNLSKLCLAGTLPDSFPGLTNGPLISQTMMIRLLISRAEQVLLLKPLVKSLVHAFRANVWLAQCNRSPVNVYCTVLRRRVMPADTHYVAVNAIIFMIPNNFYLNMYLGSST